MSTFIDFNAEFPDDASCLKRVFQQRFGDLTTCPQCGVVDTKFYPVKGRQCYACKWCGYQIYPLVGTVLKKTHVPLRVWFFVLYLFSISKHGVSAAEVRRYTGVSYKTAFRMVHVVRRLMAQPTTQLNGVVEADEAYLGGRMIEMGNKRYWKNQSVILGVVERGGEARAVVARGANATTVLPFLKAKVRQGAKLYTDDSRIYHRTSLDYYHDSVNHVRHQYARGAVHTNTIEGFWSHLKRSLKGTYHGVSPKYLQNYIDEAVWRHNHRDEDSYPLLLNLAM